MFCIADFGAFFAAILMFLALPRPGTFALLNSTGNGGFGAGAATTAGLILGDRLLLRRAVAGVVALRAAHPMWFKALRYLGAVYPGWVGSRLLLACGAAVTSPVRKVPNHRLRQALLIALLNPKAIVFCMAFLPLLIDPAAHRGWPTLAAMALTIATLTAACCVAQCGSAQGVSQHERAYRRPALALQRLAGPMVIGFGLRLVRD